MKPRYQLLLATDTYYLFIEQTGPGLVKYLMPRWRWAVMCEGRWPW